MLREAFLIFSGGAMENRSFTLVYLLLEKFKSLLREVNRVTIYHNREFEKVKRNSYGDWNRWIVDGVYTSSATELSSSDIQFLVLRRVDPYSTIR